MDAHSIPMWEEHTCTNYEAGILGLVIASMVSIIAQGPTMTQDQGQEVQRFYASIA